MNYTYTRTVQSHGVNCCDQVTPPPAPTVVADMAGEKIRTRHLGRRSLGETYPDVVSHVSGLLRRLPGNPELIVDATDVGRPVVDQMRVGGLAPIPVTVTSGKATKRERRGWRAAGTAVIQSSVSFGGPLTSANGMDQLLP